MSTMDHASAGGATGIARVRTRRPNDASGDAGPSSGQARKGRHVAETRWEDGTQPGVETLQAAGFPLDQVGWINWKFRIDLLADGEERRRKFPLPAGVLDKEELYRRATELDSYQGIGLIIARFPWLCVIDLDRCLVPQPDGGY